MVGKVGQEYHRDPCEFFIFFLGMMDDKLLKCNGLHILHNVNKMWSAIPLFGHL
jgi:hypothetical protein